MSTRRDSASRRGAALRVALAFLLLLPMAVALAKEPTARLLPPGAVISSATHYATDAGQDVIAKGGNAFDAAVAVSAALSVTEPSSSGLGGGGFFLLHEGKSGRDVMVDARETAPAAANPAMYLDANGELDRDKAINGPTSAGIPGLPAALVHLARKYGRLPLSVTLAPAIRLARDGFEVYPRMENFYAERRAAMERFEGTRKVYLADGDPPKAGEILKQPDLARTLELIAAQGFDGFYRGPTAQRMLEEVKKYGGNWTASDLADYTVKEREPIRIRYRDFDLVTAPPPSSGGVALAEILQILEGWDLAKLDEAQRVHLIVEAMRRAYRDRGLYLGDPDFVKMPIARLTSDDYAAGLRASILPDKATPSSMLPAGKPPLDGSGNTTHFSIIDGEGNYVGATQTVNLAFGSGMIVDGTGILLNDEMDDFALKPATPNSYGVIGYDANAVAPGRRPLSSMSPTFMSGRGQVAVVGAKGGSRIITMVLLGLLGIEQGMSPEQIAAMPRFHHQYLPDRISAEPGAIAPDTQKALEAMGYTVRQEAGLLPFYLHAVDWNQRSNTLRGGADPRNSPGSASVVLTPAKEAKR